MTHPHHWQDLGHGYQFRCSVCGDNRPAGYVVKELQERLEPLRKLAELAECSVDDLLLAIGHTLAAEKMAGEQDDRIT